MKFKNELERNTFEIARRVCGDEASIAHNQALQIEVALAPEVASFIGPPKKEIEVITAGFLQSPGVKLLISCKQYRNSKAEPADVQEWAAVVSTMNKYSQTTEFLGLVLSPGGFTSGCEPWASSYNLGIIPPLKAKKLDFSLETSGQIFERVLVAFGKRLNFPHEILHEAPQFYEFVYHMTEQFERKGCECKTIWRAVQTAREGLGVFVPRACADFHGQNHYGNHDHDARYLCHLF